VHSRKKHVPWAIEPSRQAQALALKAKAAPNGCNCKCGQRAIDFLPSDIHDTSGVMALAYLYSLTGGALIGLASALYLLLDGRIAGVSGIIGGSLKPLDDNQLRNAAFLLGLLLGPVIYRLAFAAWPLVHYEASLWIYAAAGLLVGFGTRLGSGCTSGHGVCGLARLSRRSIAAVATFLLTGMAAVAVMNALGI
jgi:hypothetical protein